MNKIKERMLKRKTQQSSTSDLLKYIVLRSQNITFDLFVQENMQKENPKKSHKSCKNMNKKCKNGKNI